MITMRRFLIDGHNGVHDRAETFPRRRSVARSFSRPGQFRLLFQASSLVETARITITTASTTTDQG